MRVFSNTISSFPIDMKSSKTTTSLLQSSQQSSHRHPAVHPRLTDAQICPNEIIDLTSASTKETIPVNLNAQARSYELTKINNNMSAYDVNSQNSSIVSSFVSEKCLEIMQGISKGEKNYQSRVIFNSWMKKTEKLSVLCLKKVASFQIFAKKLYKLFCTLIIKIASFFIS